MQSDPNKISENHPIASDYYTADYYSPSESKSNKHSKYPS